MISSGLISAVVIFHGEGLLAHKTLLGLERVRLFAENQDVSVELVVVLDEADLETERIVRTSPVLRESDQVLSVNNTDLGVSRNDGVAAARGDYVGMFDGDDYYSENWIIGALHTHNSKEGDVVVHPNYVVCFGIIHSIGQSLDLDRNPEYPLANCFSVHPWVSSSFAKRLLYLDHPYVRTDTIKTGFGFEDWHWNLELLGCGVRHVSAPGTALFYRRKPGSMLLSHLNNKAIVRPNRFFATPEKWHALPVNYPEASSVPEVTC